MMLGSEAAAADPCGVAAVDTRARGDMVRSDTELVAAARSDEPEVFGQLVERWFDRCWEVAWRILHDRDLAADVAQDTLLTAWRQLDRLQDPAAFGGWVLRIARNRALDRLARERRTRPTGDHDELELGVPGHDTTGPEAAFTRGQQRDMVWAAAAALGERDASLLDLHLRHGLEPAEIAEELGIAPNAAHQALFRLRKRLGSAIQAWLLWRDAAPACVVLRAELAAAGVTDFDAATATAINTHVRNCDECADERERVVAPAALFSAVPFVAAPLALRAQAVSQLAAAGVPVGGASTLEGAADADAHADGGPDMGGHGGGSDAGGDGGGSTAVDGGGAGGGSDVGGHGGGSDVGGHGVGSIADADEAGAAVDADSSATAVGDVADHPVHTSAAHASSTGETATIVSSATADGADGWPAPVAEARRASPTSSLVSLAGLVLLVVGALTWWLMTAPSQPTDSRIVLDEPVVDERPVDDDVPVAVVPSARPADGDEAAPPADSASSDEPAAPAAVPERPPGEPLPGDDPPDDRQVDDPVADPAQPDAPEVTRLTARPVGQCQSSRVLLVALAWEVERADTATLTGPDGDAEEMPVAGTARRCAVDGAVFTLTADGPGGTAVRTVLVRGPDDTPDLTVPEVDEAPELTVPEVDRLPEPVRPGSELLVPEADRAGRVAPQVDRADQSEPLG